MKPLAHAISLSLEAVMAGIGRGRSRLRADRHAAGLRSPLLDLRAAKPARGDDEIANLKAELSAMQRRLDQLSKR